LPGARAPSLSWHCQIHLYFECQGSLRVGRAFRGLDSID
jgi:hypothetical protein